jgi:hypothetical protein
LAGTWNTSGTPTAIKCNITDTASNASALLMQLQTGGVNRMVVTKAGVATIGSAAIAGGGVVLNLVSSFGTFTAAVIGGGGLSTSQAISTSGTLFAGLLAIGGDALLARDASNTFAQRNTTNAQTLRVYNTFTSATNFERATIGWAANLLSIGTEKGSGGGTARALAIVTDGTARINVGAAGEIGLYGVTAVARATTAGAAATFVANTSGIANDTATWGGYTIGQVVAALRNIGILT